MLGLVWKNRGFRHGRDKPGHDADSVDRTPYLAHMVNDRGYIRRPPGYFPGQDLGWH